MLHVSFSAISSLALLGCSLERKGPQARFARITLDLARSARGTVSFGQSLVNFFELHLNQCAALLG